MTDINMRLSTSSINQAIREIKKYKRNLEKKNKLFVQRLAEVGIPVIDQTIEGQGDSSTIHGTAIRVTGKNGTVTGFLAVSGEDILFWEFGAGVRYNDGEAHPKAKEFGMGVGTYPGQTHVPVPGFWYYKPEGSDTYVRSYGTEATMPVYKASLEIRKQMNQIAREVFGNGN